jgi:hypothetical protein
MIISEQDFDGSRRHSGSLLCKFGWTRNARMVADILSLVQAAFGVI